MDNKYTLDTTSNNEYYIILENGEELFKISKKNDINNILKLFNYNIEIIK